MANITGTNLNDTLFGTSANDVINGLAGNDTLQGLEGNDILDAGLGFDTVRGGAGTDILKVNYSSLGSSIFQGFTFISTSNNSISFSGIERFNITGGSASDNLLGGAFTDTLIGGAGNDTLDGGNGNDSLNGGSGNDLITKGGGVDVVDGGADTDTLVDADLSLLTTNLTLTISGGVIPQINLSDGTLIKNFEFFQNIFSGRGNDSINITANGVNNNNRIEGGVGNDTLNPGLGFDTVNGGQGNDVLKVNYSSLSSSIFQNIGFISTSNNSISYSGIERFNITGGSASDNLVGGVFADTLIGGEGSDTLNGGDGNDSLNGGKGDDLITKGGGSDKVDGGSGKDVLVDADLSLLTTDLTLSISGGVIPQINLSDGTLIKNFEFFQNIILGSGNDSIDITSNTTVPNNNIEGGLGNDTLNPGLGLDTVNGGQGNDVLKVNYSSLSSSIFQGFTSISTSNNSISFSGIERFDIRGGSADDNLIGGTFKDTLKGGTGKDTLTGGDDNDSLTGDNGDDRLIGGGGNDTLSGGTGADQFVFNSPEEGIDSIINFVIADDSLEVSNSGFGFVLSKNADNTLLASQFRTGTAATTVDHRFIYNNTNGILFFDPDGTQGGAQSFPKVQIAVFDTKPALTNADILVI